MRPRAVVLSTVLLVLNYLLVTVAAPAFAGVGSEGIGPANEAGSEDVLAGWVARCSATAAARYWACCWR